MAVELGTGYVSIVPSTKGIGASLATQLGAPAEKAGVDAGKAAGGGFASGMSSVVKGVGASLLVGAGIGAGLLAVGSEFHAAFSKIRIDTGETGTALDGLEGSFKNVLAQRPDSIDNVALAISKLRVGLGLTGKPLEEMSKQVLRLSAITKTDLGANLTSVTQLFNNFGVAAADQGAKLDELFRASQATGISVSDLATAMANSGGVLRTAGFSFEDSAAILGLLSKQGINVSTVMPALSKSIKEAAANGKTAAQVFQETFDAIKNAPDATTAAGKAMEVFGARAGPKLAASIREGKLSYEDLAKTITSGSDTIQKAADDTATFGGKWKIFLNSLRVAIEPLATALFGLATDALGALAPALAKIGPALGPPIAAIKLFFDAINGDLGDATGVGSFAVPIVKAGAQVGQIFTQIGDQAGKLFQSLSKVDWGGIFDQAVAILQPLVEAFAGLGKAVVEFAVAEWPAVISAVQDALPAFAVVAGVVGGALIVAIKGLTLVVGFLTDHMEILAPILVTVGAGFLALKTTQAAVSGVRAVADGFDTLITKAGAAQSAITTTASKITGFFKAGGGKDKIGFFRLFDNFGGVVADVKAQLASAGTAVTNFGKNLGSKISSAFTTATSAASSFGSRVASTVGNAAKTVGSSLKTAGSAALSFGRNAAVAAANVAKQTAAFVAQKVAAAAAAVATKVMAAAQWLLNAAMDANPITLIVIGIAALVAGVILAYQHFTPFREAVDALFGIIKDLAGWVIDHWPLVLAVLLGPFGVLVAVVIKNFDTIKSAITDAVSFIISFVSANWPFLFAILTGGLSLVLAFIIDHWNTIKNVFSTALAIIQTVVTSVVNGIVGFWTGAWNLLVGVVTAIWGGITAAVSGGLRFVRAVFDGFIGGFNSAWNGFWNGLKNVVQGIAGPIASAFEAVIDGVRRAWNAFAGAWNDISISVPSVDFGPVHVGGGSIDTPNLPKLATGAIIKARKGGTQAVLAERGQDEAVIPLPKLKDLAAMIAPAVSDGGGSQGSVVQIDTINAWNAEDAADAIADRIAWNDLTGDRF